MRDVNIAMEVLSIIISFILFYCLIIEKNKTILNKIFIWMLIINTLVLTCDLLTWLLNPNYELILYISNFFVYSLGYIICALFTMYIVIFLSIEKKIKKIILYVNFVLCGIAIVLVIISMFNKMYFSYENGIYQRGNFYMVSQIYSLIIMALDAILILVYHKKISLRDTISLLSYEILPIITLTIQIFIYGITLLYISTTLSMLIIYITIQVNQSKRLKEKENELTQAKISIMLSQIQPHFLYNSLTSIAELCDIDSRSAKNAIISFSKFLRANIDSLKQNKPLPFDKELNHVRTYLDLEKMRFGDDLNIIYDIETTFFLIPMLTVQPLVENAVKYGIRLKEDGGTIKIVTREEKQFILIEVIDDGIGYDTNEVKYDGRSHIGIDNVRSRLNALCNGKLEIDSIKGKGTTVRIIIPKGENNDKSYSSR